ncbi:hypothetical protein ACFXCZ_21335 [Streptomyces sp. NPDC059396]|uniref:hypothetical protein n=1 Tax=Streptomyces sp. NPDC059396 TaxID=3346819 RepID=UPI0036C82129
MVHRLKVVVPVLALVAVAAGCSSSEGEDEQRLTRLRENYCLYLGTWQEARNAAATVTPESTANEEAELVGQDVFVVMRPLRDETVSGGRTLGEETVLAINNGDGNAEAHVVRYCGDAGFETLTR